MYEKPNEKILDTQRTVAASDMNEVLAEAQEIISAKADSRSDREGFVEFLADEDQPDPPQPPTGRASKFGMLIPFSITISQAKNRVYLLTTSKGPELYAFLTISALTSGLCAILHYPTCFVKNELILEPDHLAEPHCPGDFIPLEHAIVIAPSLNRGLTIDAGCFMACFTEIHEFLENFSYFFARQEEFKEKHVAALSKSSERFYPQPGSVQGEPRKPMGRAKTT